MQIRDAVEDRTASLYSALLRDHPAYAGQDNIRARVPHSFIGSASGCRSVERMVQCVLDGAREKLPLQVNHRKARAGVNVLVSGHLGLRNLVLQFDLDICFGSRHDARMKILFLQLR